MSRKEHEERATHHVHLWLANDYNLYKMVQEAIREARKNGADKKRSIARMGRAFAADLEGQKADGFKFTASRIASYVATEWDEQDLYEANNAKW